MMVVVMVMLRRTVGRRDIGSTCKVVCFQIIGRSSMYLVKYFTRQC